MTDKARAVRTGNASDRQVLVASIRDELRILKRLLEAADMPATRHIVDVATASFLDELIERTEYHDYREMMDELAAETGLVEELLMAVQERPTPH